jgi:phosphonate transport system permease protein
MLPDWVSVSGDVTTIDLGTGHVVTYDEAGARFVVPGYGTIDVRPDGKPVLTAPEPVPDWINAVAENKVSVTTEAGRFNYTRSKVETFRYQPGVGAVVLHPRQPVLRKGLCRTGRPCPHR